MKSTKTMQPVLPSPKDELEDWQRWLNRIETDLRLLSYYKKRKIIVRYA